MRVVVLTGAGISAESGVPTFRDANHDRSPFPDWQTAVAPDCYECAVVDSRTGVILFILIWLGGAVALGGMALGFGKWLLLAAAVWLIPVGFLVASLVVVLVL